MKDKLFFSAVLFLFSIGCSKHEDDPSTPVVNFAKAINAYDSLGMINCLSSLARDRYYDRPDTARGLDYFKKVRMDVKVLWVEKDSNSDNQAKVFVLENLLDHEKKFADTFCYRVFKEKDGWKLMDMAF